MADDELKQELFKLLQKAKQKQTPTENDRITAGTFKLLIGTLDKDAMDLDDSDIDVATEFWARLVSAAAEQRARKK